MPVDPTLLAALNYRDQQSAKNPWLDLATTAGNGLGRGMLQNFENRIEDAKTEKKYLLEERSNEKKYRHEAFNEFIKNNMLYDKATNTPLDMNALYQVRESFVNGSGMPQTVGAVRVKEAGKKLTQHERQVFNPTAGTYKPSGIKYMAEEDKPDEVDRMSTSTENGEPGITDKLKALNVQYDNLMNQRNSVLKNGSANQMEDIKLIDGQIQDIANKIAALNGTPTIGAREVQPPASTFRKVMSAIPYTGVSPLPPKQTERYLIPASGASQSNPDPVFIELIRKAKAAGGTPEQIRQALINKRQNPSIYGY